MNPGYIFRGEASFSSPLRTSLERGFEEIHGADKGISGDLLQTYERECVEKFVWCDGRIAAVFYPKAKQLRQHPREDTFWWLSLMQHYQSPKQGWCSPTRLLDFSRDIYVALYFALAHCERHLKETGRTLDPSVYCFPCQNPRHPNDPDNNKGPIRHERVAVDMNLALGGLIGVEWLKGKHQEAFEHQLKHKRDDQEWGWDMPKYQNPRLKEQQGMFVYPFAYPADGSPLQDGESWLLRALNLKQDDPFNLGVSASEWPGMCLRIPASHSEQLRHWLRNEKKINCDTIFERYTLLAG